MTCRWCKRNTCHRVQIMVIQWTLMSQDNSQFSPTWWTTKADWMIVKWAVRITSVTTSTGVSEVPLTIIALTCTVASRPTSKASKTLHWSTRYATQLITSIVKRTCLLFRLILISTREIGVSPLRKMRLAKLVLASKSTPLRWTSMVQWINELTTRISSRIMLFTSQSITLSGGIRPTQILCIIW